MVEELESGIRRVTFDLPFGIDHVHCYFLRSTSGGWILVDTGLGSRDPEARWRPVLDELDAPIERIVVTHMHPDHVGGARDIAGLTGAPVLQGREDHAQCVRAWGEREPGAVRARTGPLTGCPRATSRGSRRSPTGCRRRPLGAGTRELLDAGDEIDGWRVEVLRGHADGHIVLLRDGVMIAGDVILERDHAGDRPLSELAPRPARRLLSKRSTGSRSSLRASRTPATRTPVLDPAGRAREIRAHHVERLDHTAAALERPAALGVRGLAVALRSRSLDDAAPLCDGGGARAPRAPRARAPGGPRGLRLRDSRLIRADTIARMEPLRIGVLAVQGNFREHAQMLRRLGAEAVEVRKPEQLDGLDGLIIPGGESTTFTRLMQLYGLDEAIRRFRGAVFGTCAGMIVLDRNHLGLVDLAGPPERVRPAGGVVRDRSRRRRAGRSGARGLHPRAVGRGGRARRSRCSPRSTAGRCSRARGASSLAAFHPELTDDTRLHEQFLELVREEQRVGA